MIVAIAIVVGDLSLTEILFSKQINNSFIAVTIIKYQELCKTFED